MCIDYGFDSYCYVKADTPLPADGWSNTELRGRAATTELHTRRRLQAVL